MRRIKKQRPARRTKNLDVERVLVIEFTRFYRRHKTTLSHEDFVVLRSLFNITAMQRFVDGDIETLAFHEKVARKSFHKRRLAFLAKKFASQLYKREITNLSDNRGELERLHMQMKAQGCDIYPCLRDDEESISE